MIEPSLLRRYGLALAALAAGVLLVLLWRAGSPSEGRVTQRVLGQSPLVPLASAPAPSAAASTTPAPRVVSSSAAHVNAAPSTASSAKGSAVIVSPSSTSIAQVSVVPTRARAAPEHAAAEHDALAHAVAAALAAPKQGSRPPVSAADTPVPSVAAGSELAAPAVAAAPARAASSNLAEPKSTGLHGTAEASEQAQPAHLSLDSAPWSKVYLGSRLLGTTPLIDVLIPPGRQVLTLSNNELGISTTYVVNIAPGASLKRLVGWGKE